MSKVFMLEERGCENRLHPLSLSPTLVPQGYQSLWISIASSTSYVFGCLKFKKIFFLVSKAD